MLLKIAVVFDKFQGFQMIGLLDEVFLKFLLLLKLLLFPVFDKIRGSYFLGWLLYNFLSMKLLLLVKLMMQDTLKLSVLQIL